MKWNEHIKPEKDLFKVSDQYFDKLHQQITQDTNMQAAKKVALYNKVILGAASIAASVLLVLTVVMNFPEKNTSMDISNAYVFQTQLTSDELFEIMMEEEELQPSSEELLEYAALGY